MHKLTALFSNELLKIRKKPSVLVFLILIVLCGFFTPGLIKLMDFATNNLLGMTGNYVSDDSWMKDDMENQLNNYRTQAKDIEQQIKDATSGSVSEEEKQYTLDMLNESKASTEDTIELYTMAKEKEIYPNNQSGYLVDSINQILTLRSDVRTLQKSNEPKPSDETSALITAKDALEKQYMSVIESKDFNLYLESRKSQLNLDATLDDDHKAIEMDLLDLEKKILPNGDLDNSSETYRLTNVLNAIRMVKTSILDGVDHTDYYNVAGPMTLDEKTDMENLGKIIDYRFANDCFPLQGDSETRFLAINTAYSGGVFLITIMMMILAGSAISQEIATGSIKSLVIAPVRRWKIFAAKLTSLIFVGFVAMILLFVAGFIGQGLFFGFNGNMPYIYIANGEVASLPFLPFMFLKLMCSFLEVIFFLFFAFMLSVVTRNTALSVALSIGAYFAGNIVKQTAIIMPNLEILKFIPFFNLNLAERIFTYSYMMDGTIASSSLNMFTQITAFRTPTVMFSALYLAALSFLLLYIAYDSFTRRDIR